MSDGLPSAGITGVTIGPRGAVWARHQEVDEVTELTGYGNESQSVPAGSANKVHASRSGQLWTMDPEGLWLYSKGAWKHFPIPPIQRAYQGVVQRLRSPVNLLPLQINQCLILAGNGLYLFNAANTSTKNLNIQGLDAITGHAEMVRLRQGSLVIAGHGGFLRLQGPAKEIQQRPPVFFPLPSVVSSYQLNSPLENPGEVLTFIGTSEGLPRLALRHDEDGWQWFPVPSETKLRSFWEDTAGRGWGTTYNGLYELDMVSESILESETIEAGLFFDVVTDGDKSTWIATSEGIVRQSPSQWQSLYSQLRDQTIFDMVSDAKNHLWLVTEKALVQLSDSDVRHIPWPSGMDSIFQPGNSIFMLANGQVGINAGRSPLIYDPASATFQSIPPPSPATSVQQLLGLYHNQELILKLKALPGQSPLWFFDWKTTETKAFQPDPSLDDREFLWASTLPDEIWFGSTEGISYAKGGQWIHFEPEDGLGGDLPQCMLELMDGRLWVGAGSHIYELQSSRWERIYFAHEKINGMLETRGGAVWLASNNGIHRYFQDTWITHNLQEGLPSNTIYKLHEDASGVIRAATTRGLSQFDAQSDRAAPVTLIRMAGKDLQRDIRSGTSILFEGRDKWEHTTPSRLLFSYRQDSESWKPFSYTNRVVLGDLSAGPHQLEVRSMDRNGNIETQAATLKFNFTIPWNEDPRLMQLTMAALFVTLVLSGFAVNRHLRLKRSYAEVEKIVADRTAALERANNQLLQDHKMKALGTLTSGIAHDFNSILSIIKGSVQIIESNPENSSKVRKRVARIHSVVDQGAGLVRSMLGYVRKQNKTSKPHDLNRVLHEAVRLSEDNASAARIKFMENPEIGEVHIMPDLMRQMVINITNNAIDSMDASGTICISLALAREFRGHVALKPHRDDLYAVIQIMDTGVGIPKEMIARIFEPFYTTKAFSSRRGTGLGLSMVYEMAREMGAGLSVDSSPGQGSQFFIYVPMSVQREVSLPEGMGGGDLRKK
ncbi:MAG: ATP-binding protein [Verrucomicrobiota bacterium]|nr:ATP-binding protein [Verrucomicrobiota bacterium]